MAKALHVIAEQQGRSPRGVSRIGTVEFKSECWTFLGDNPQQLLGGWLYLHEKSTAPSIMGGKVSQVVECTRDARIEKGYAFIFAISPKGRNVRWRGNGNIRHGHSGFVEADLVHEQD